MSISLIYNFLQGVTTSNASTTTTMPPSPPNPPPLNTTLNQTPVATSRSSLTTYTTNCFKRKKTSLSNIQKFLMFQKSGKESGKKELKISIMNNTMEVQVFLQFHTSQLGNLKIVVYKYLDGMDLQFLGRTCQLINEDH